MFEIHNKKSFESIKGIPQEILTLRRKDFEELPIFLVGYFTFALTMSNKADLCIPLEGQQPIEREVKLDEILALAKEWNIPYWEIRFVVWVC